VRGCAAKGTHGFTLDRVGELILADHDDGTPTNHAAVDWRCYTLGIWAGREALVHPLGGDIPRLKFFLEGRGVRELSIFIDESGDFGPAASHSPWYVLSLVFHDQSNGINRHLDHIHRSLTDRGLPARHAIHTGPLIRREADYRWMGLADRRSIFRVLVDFVRHCEVSHHSWVFRKRDHADGDVLLGAMARRLGAFIRENTAFFSKWDRIVIYYDGGQKEITNLVNSVFNAHLSTVEVRRVVPADYSLFQVADLCCTLTLLQTKIESGGLSASERAFFSTPRTSAERALKKGYFKTMGKKQFAP
jgi:hypothetical protein